MIMSRVLPAYSVRRSSRARRARLTISRTGDAVVVLPNRAPDRAAAELVARHADWIARHIGRIEALSRALAARPAWGEGRYLSFGGVEHLVTVHAAPNGRRSRVVLAGEPGEPTISIWRAATETRTTTDILETWLRRAAREAIAERVGRRAGEMGVTPTAVAIRDQRSRWGSASVRGSLSFSWRLVLCPPDILDYVVVHELAHLSIRGHSPAFWALVARHFADPAAARLWLRQNHSQLRHAID
jgi:predicted metal-dependent hydrolase